MDENRWRNPALDDAAREKLPRPRKHGDEPVLHSALEKLRGSSMVNLTPEEREAHRAYQRRLRQARLDDVRAYYRHPLIRWHIRCGLFGPASVAGRRC